MSSKNLLTKNEPIWLTVSDVLTVHAKEIELWGGLSGTLNYGLLESAVYRPQQLLAYGPKSLIDLAAAYAYGITRNHPFFDGNKRTGFVSMDTFLRMNGVEIELSEDEIETNTLSLAKGTFSEDEYIFWLSQNMVP